MVVNTCVHTELSVYFSERTSHKLWLLRLGILAEILLKVNKVYLIWGKTVAIFAANDKFWVFKETLKIQKAYTEVCFIDLLGIPQPITVDNQC